MLNYKRSERVAELIQQHISKIIQELDISELGFVTITGVKLTDDLLDAKVYYSIIGSEEKIKDSTKILNTLLPEIRHQIARRINLRRTPVITLIFDKTPEHANKIFEILEKIKSENIEITDKQPKTENDDNNKAQSK